MAHLRKKIVVVLTIVSLVSVSSGLYFWLQNNQKITANRKLTAIEILSYLPNSIHIFVYHNVDTLKNYFDSQTILKMFLLSNKTSIDALDGIILTNEGTYLILDGLIFKNGMKIEKQFLSMDIKIGDKIRTFFGSNNQIDTLGYADNESTLINSSSYLCVTIKNGIGFATAVFSVLPSTKNYDLLEVIGISYYGYTSINNYYYLNFTSNILIHVGAGELMNFTHTQKCVDFFINGAVITPESEISLRQVIRARAEQVGSIGANFLFNSIKNRELYTSPLLAENVSMGTSDRFGNIASYGIVAKALQRYNLNSSKIRQWLIAHQKYGLWGFHAGPVNTSIVCSGTNAPVEVDAIDSALVFEGLFNLSSIALLDIYRRPSGGFTAQLNDTGGPYSMNSSNQIWFWCQEDYGVTANAFYFLNNLSLSNSSILEYLKLHFNERCSMWLANPYYIEYLTARALKNQTGTAIYLQNITQKILNETNLDGSWGNYDKALSTAFAILTLKELNYTGLELDRGLLQLIKMQQANGNWNSSDIYFSALDRGLTNLYKSININGEYFDYILYKDIDSIITTSYCILALSNPISNYSIAPENIHTGSPFHTPRSYIEYVLNNYVT